MTQTSPLTKTTTTTCAQQQLPVNSEPTTDAGANRMTNANPKTSTIADKGTLSSNRGFRLLR